MSFKLSHDVFVRLSCGGKENEDEEEKLLSLADYMSRKELPLRLLMFSDRK